MSKSQQNYLDQVAQRLHLTADAQSGILFGMQGGLHMMLMRSTSNQNFVSLVFSLTHSGQEPDETITASSASACRRSSRHPMAHGPLSAMITMTTTTPA